MVSTPLQIISFEPNTRLTNPYLLFPQSYHFSLHRSLQISFLASSPQVPSFVTVSSSFSPEKIVEFLWQLRNYYDNQIIPVIFVIDWSQPLAQIPGTTWGGKVGVLHSMSSEHEVVATLKRLHAELAGTTE